MTCSNCGKRTYGGYCDCMIVDGEFKGAWWLEEKKMEGNKMNVKSIVVPNRDASGWLHGTKTVAVEWNCPTCGEEMSEPKIESFCEDGEWYAVHKWDNVCGHVAKYTDLKEI